MCDKESYTTREDARAAAKGLSRNHRRSMYFYPCDQCGVWHIATKRRRFKRSFSKHEKYPLKVLVKLGKKIVDLVVRHW